MANVGLANVLVDGEELDPPLPMVVMLHKPVGYVVTAPDDDKVLDPVVYDLLPYRCVYRLGSPCTIFHNGFLLRLRISQNLRAA
jgi:16S rRNA U516 pseudouridylate synthase RsuA-like enzyme